MISSAPALSVSGPGALCIGARRSLCRSRGFVALYRAQPLSLFGSGSGALSFVSKPAALCESGPALCRGPALSRRSLRCSLRRSLSVSGAGARWCRGVWRSLACCVGIYIEPQHSPAALFIRPWDPDPLSRATACFASGPGSFRAGPRGFLRWSLRRGPAVSVSGLDALYIGGRHSLLRRSA